MVTIFALGFGACSVGQVEGLTTDGGGGVDANPAAVMAFTTTIQPLVSRCTQSACHGMAHQVGTPNLTSFSLLDAKYKAKPGTNNILVTKAPANAIHETIMYFTDADKATVAAWIDSI